MADKYMNFIVEKTDPYTNRHRKQITIYKNRVFDSHGDFAAHLIMEWGKIAYAEDGEDKTGRQKARLLTPGEIVARACEATEIMYAEFEKREWFIHLPDLKQINSHDDNDDEDK